MREELSPAIDNYIRFRKSQDYKPGTIKVDVQVLKKFLAVNGNIYCHTITHRHVERHFEEVTRTRKSSSLKNDHGVLVRFFKWARHTGRMPVETDPMFGRRQPKAVKRERNRIPVTQFGQLLDTAGERDPRDRALLALLLYTLARDSEITDLRVRDLDLATGDLKIRIHKTGVEDTLPVSSELDREMRAWLTHYGAESGPLEGHHHLVPARAVHPIRNELGQITHHLSTYRPEKRIRAAGRVVSPVLERMGFPVVNDDGSAAHEGAHTIRRSGARALFDDLSANGYDHGLRIVQSMLHHASVTMTEQYLGITADRKTRDELIRGRAMYSHSREGSVIKIAR